MPTEEQYAAIGKAHADLKNAQEKLKALKARAADMGKQYEQLGQYLLAAPHMTGLNGESPIPVNWGQGYMFDRKLFDANKFQDVTKGIREAMLEIERLDSILK